MVTTAPKLDKYTNEYFIERLQNGGALLPDTPEHVTEVVGILKSYGIVLDSYSKNLIYIAENQYLVFFPFFKYFDGEVSANKLFKHLWHNRINFEYAEYCMKAMLWHGGGGLDKYLDTPEFIERAKAVIAAKFQNNPLVLGVNQLFPDFLVEQLRVYAYYKGLGQFWRIMSDMFIELSDRYDRGEIKTIPHVVDHIKSALVANASHPIYYTVNIGGKEYEILPKSAGLTFLMDTAVPYVEAIFFRGTPFQGTVSFNAQAGYIPVDQAKFQYGALYADPLPVGGAGIPPTLTMQDMRHHLPDYMHEIYQRSRRGEDDLRVQICMSFQKSMFCVTTAAVLGLMPHAIDTQDPKEQKLNHKYLEGWLERLENSRLQIVNS
jgi:CO2 hydration protein